MGLTADQKEGLAELAKRLIGAMGRIDASAQRALQEGIGSNPSSAANVFAFVQNAMVGPAPEALRLSGTRAEPSGVNSAPRRTIHRRSSCDGRGEAGE